MLLIIYLSDRHFDRTSLIASFHLMISCLKPLIDPDVMKDIDAFLEEMKPTSLVEINPEVSEKLQSIISVLVKTLDSDLQESISLCVESVLLVAMDTEGDIAKLGKAWVLLGHLQMQLLAPKGPVDPIERQAVKLRILKQQVGQNGPKVVLFFPH